MARKPGTTLSRTNEQDEAQGEIGIEVNETETAPETEAGEAPAAEGEAETETEQETETEGEGSETAPDAGEDEAAAAQATVAAAKAALLAAALVQAKVGAAAPKARTKRHGYGVFETPDGHLLTINYDERGRETDWTLTAPDLSWKAIFPRKKDALDWIDATGDLPAQKAAIAALSA